MEQPRRSSSAGQALQRTVLRLLGAWLALGCQSEAAQPDVAYGTGPALGTWVAPSQPTTLAGTGGAPSAGADGEAVAGSGGIDGAAGDTGFAGTGGIGGTGVAGTGGIGATGFAGTGGTSGTAGMSGIDGAAGMAGAAGMGGSTLSSLTFEVLTHSQGGRYSPKNIGAIWVSTSSGSFVKTLEVWAGTRARYLRRWNAESGGSRVDAVSGATLRSHATHAATWDLADVSGAPVAPGEYKVIIELTDADATGESYEVPFTYGEPLSLTPADATYYSGMTLSVQ